MLRVIKVVVAAGVGLCGGRGRKGMYGGARQGKP